MGVGGTEQMTTILPTNKLRGLVSKKKKRFQEGGYVLDLSYITDNIIAMGFPSESLEGIYRNPMKEVQKFMDELHGSHYKIYNLCSERRYDHSKLQGRVREFPFDDHNPCPLALILEFCRDVHEWLNAHPENVVAIQFVMTINMKITMVLSIRVAIVVANVTEISILPIVPSWAILFSANNAILLHAVRAVMVFWIRVIS